VTDLLYHVERSHPATDAVLAFVFESLGIRAKAGRPSELGNWPHLLYGGHPAVPPNGVAIPERSGDLLWPELLAGAVEPASLDGRVPFDLVGAIGAFLRDEVHGDVDPSGYDVHDRLTYCASLPARAGFGARAIVNVYVDFLGRLLSERLGLTGKARWPHDKAAAIGLSHDVDLPDRYAFLSSAVRPWRLRRAPRTYVLRTLELAAARARDPNPRAFWLFDEVAASESSLGFRSTFFFATVPFHSRRGAGEDVAYDAGERRFRTVFRWLREAGFEIGLHASYRACEDVSRLLAERRRLSDLAQTEVNGVRHHYWHLGRDVRATLRAHEDAGFGYDTSLAFNEHPGFRRSVALPFHVYDPDRGRPLRTIELPTFCMDGSLLYRSRDVDAAVATVDGLIDEIVETGGMGAINWHSHTSYPTTSEFHAWGVTYQEILRLLASRSDVWTTSLGSIASWVSERRADLGDA
jgi:hypothetical protein